MTGLAVFGCDADEAELFRRLGPALGVVPTITGDPLSERNAAAAAGRRCASVGHKAAITAAELRALRDVGVVRLSTRSIGLDHIDLRAARELGIEVTGVEYAPDGVADFTVMLILMAIRRAKRILTAVERGDLRLGPDRGRDLRDLTIGVVGVGRIGSAVVHRLQGFGCRVLACRRRRGPMPGAELVSLEHLLRVSDVVTLHPPLDATTHHLIGRRQLATMKRGAVLVNTGRGALVDTDALIDALERGHLGGVALDVLEGELGLFYADRTSAPIDHRALLRLHALPNAIVTPHTAFHTERALYETVEATLLDCLDLDGRGADGPTQGRDLVRGLL